MQVLRLLTIIGSCWASAASTSIPCVTPNSEEALCVSLFSCGVLQQALNGDEISKEFVKASKCGDDFMVCCGTSGNFTARTTTTSTTTAKPERTEPPKEFKRDFVLRRILPSLTYCGYQHSDDYVREENRTSIDEFPWIVHIDYPSPYARPTKGTEFKCVGVLISNNLVLTSIQCANYFALTVKFGQHYKHNKTSCVSTSLYGDECTEPVIEREGTLREVPNSDLILIRLREDVSYSDYVRPICLPFEESQRPKDNETVHTSGWGEEDIFGRTVKLKKKIVHKLLPNEEGYGSKEVNFANSNSSSYVCEGDQGGPLMYRNKKQQWFLAGVIKTIPCSSTKPAVAIRITSQVLEDIIDPIFFYFYKWND